MKEKLQAEIMKLYMQYGELMIKQKSLNEQIAAVEQKLSSINATIPLITSPTKLEDLKASKGE